MGKLKDMHTPIFWAEGHGRLLLHHSYRIAVDAIFIAEKAAVGAELAAVDVAGIVAGVLPADGEGAGGRDSESRMTGAICVIARNNHC